MVLNVKKERKRFSRHHNEKCNVISTLKQFICVQKGEPQKKKTELKEITKLKIESKTLSTPS